MSFVRFDPKLHQLKSEAYEPVDQDNSACLVYNLGQQMPLFLSEGMNPCMGIILHGYCQTKKKQQLMFTILNHCSGLDDDTLDEIRESKDDQDTFVNSFCSSEITNMLLKLEDAISEKGMTLKTVCLENTYLVRCTQRNPLNIQEEVAQKFKDLLSNSKMQLSQLINNETGIDFDVNLGKNYSLKTLEEAEADDKEAIHIFLNAEVNGLQIIYYKGHETLDGLLSKQMQDESPPTILTLRAN